MGFVRKKRGFGTNDDSKGNELKGIIKKNQTKMGLKTSEMIEQAGITSSRYYEGMKSPDRFRIGDVKALFDVLGVPEAERGMYL